MGFKSFFKFWALAAFAVTALTFTSCNDDDEEEPQSEPEPEFQTIVDNTLVSADTSETANYGGVDYPCVKVAETLQINYSGSGEPEWTCSDESLALVDQNGLVTGIDVGLVTITATVTEEWSETISSIRIYVVEGEIEVVQDDSLITYETEDYYEGYPAVQIEETLQLTYTGEGTPEWKSDTERVASVDQNGLVTGLFVGGPVKITATATTTRTMTISTVELYVIEHAIAEAEDNDLITAETEEKADYEGKSYTAVKVGLDLQLGYSGEGTPEWSVDNEKVATIDKNGKLTGVSEGLVTVTATATANYVHTTSTIQICVYIEYVTDDSLLSADTTDTAEYEGTSYPGVLIGSTLQINYSGTGTPEWRVDNDEIATIDQNGVLTAVAEGLVTVTAVVFADGVQTTSSIKICVYDDGLVRNKITLFYEDWSWLAEACPAVASGELDDVRDNKDSGYARMDTTDYTIDGTSPLKYMYNTLNYHILNNAIASSYKVTLDNTAPRIYIAGEYMRWNAADHEVSMILPELQFPDNGNELESLTFTFDFSGRYPTGSDPRRPVIVVYITDDTSTYWTSLVRYWTFPWHEEDTVATWHKETVDLTEAYKNGELNGTRIGICGAHFFVNANNTDLFTEMMEPGAPTFFLDTFEIVWTEIVEE